jgi:REP element-mobilizing transposase RayT
LYHLITRGVDRRDIFHSPEDHKKFLALLAVQKEKLPFFLYAYCLMTNHVHLLIERMTDDVGRIMHRVLTGYTQYYNRKYRRSGHLLQGRHKAILCQADRYLGELVRYIHLNPVRAKMVRKAERYPWSSQRAYLGLEEPGVADVDPVLRLFGARKAKARENFAQFVAAGARMGQRPELYEASEGCILGGEEFVDATIHHIWERDNKSIRQRRVETEAFRPEAMIGAAESVMNVDRSLLLGQSKAAGTVRAKEALIAAARSSGANTRELSALTGLNTSNISRRYDSATRRIQEDDKFRKLVDKIGRTYRQTR